MEGSSVNIICKGDPEVSLNRIYHREGQRIYYHHYSAKQKAMHDEWSKKHGKPYINPHVRYGFVQYVNSLNIDGRFKDIYLYEGRNNKWWLIQNVPRNK